MPEVTTQYYLGNDKIQYVALGDSPIATNTFRGNPNPLDVNAEAFLIATGLLGNDTINIAINNLVLALKANGFWTGLDAIYPMVGGTSTTCKYNLKDPRDLDAAFRLNFLGGWAFSNSGGAIPDAVAATYADTFYVPSTNLTTTNGHLSYYSPTSTAAAAMAEMGANGAASAGECNLALRFSDGNQYAFYAGAGGGVSAASSSTGFMINNRSTSTEGWRNGVRVINTGNGGALTSQKIVLGAQNNNGTIYRNSNRACLFASMGDTLSSPATFSTIVNNFQTELSRNIY